MLRNDVSGTLPEECSGSKAGSYLRLIDRVHHSTLGFESNTKDNNEIVKKKTSGTLHIWEYLQVPRQRAGPNTRTYVHV